MNKPAPSVPDNTLETLARNFCREARSYGFNQVDYLRYVNYLLEHSSREVGSENEEKPGYLQAVEPIDLPAVGTRVTLRAFDVDRDTERFREWLTEDYGRYFLLSRTSGRRSNVDVLLNKSDHIIGVIELNDGGKAIGSVAFLNYDPTRSKAELRKLIGDPAYRGTGLAKEATELWIRYGLSTLGLKKLYLNTLHTHIRNIKLNESLGFRVEGLLHNEALIDGEHRDVLRMGLWYDSPES